MGRQPSGPSAEGLTVAVKQGIESRTDRRGRRRYRGIVYSRSTGKVNGPWVSSHAEAKGWRTKALGEIEANTIVRPNGITLREEAEAFLAGMETGAVRDRKGNIYKPATVRGYRRGWRRIDPELGAHRLAAIRTEDVQEFVDRLNGDPELSDSTVRNTLDPLRAIYRRAMRRKRVAVNPTSGIEVPHSDNKRDRFASREEAAALIAAIREEDRALWATAFYTGLRSGELRALRWTDIHLKAAYIHVRRAFDDEAGEQTPKTRAAVRRVPLIPRLVALLEAHKRLTKRSGNDLVFGRSASEHFYRSTPRSRALSDWKAANRAKATALGRPLTTEETLRPIGLHEARHTAASLMISAGANAKALSVVMGHESITITFDRYGHLMPGGEAEVGRMLGEYIEADRR